MKRLLKVCAVLAIAFAVGCSSDDVKPTMKWEKRLETQQMYFSAPNYYWVGASKSEAAAALDVILASGLDGPSIELCGPATAQEYNGGSSSEATASRYRRNIKAYADNWQPAIEARGLVAHIAFLNTNSKKNNEVSDAEWVKLANEFMDRCSTKNKLVLPASETDPRTRASIRSALDRAFRARMGQYTIRYGGGSGLREHHSQSGTDIPRGTKDLYVVSDSGPAIGYLYGSAWRSGGTPNLGNIAKYVRTIGDRGASGAVYSFGRQFDKAGCKEAGKAWGTR